MALARLHRRIRNIRQDFLHKLTTNLAKTKSEIVMEDLNVRGFQAARLAPPVVMSGKNCPFRFGNGIAQAVASTMTGIIMRLKI
ncbi:conserved hypothetical protein [Heliomicrobium modesticaldum Ice1]|uniref:Probable transposase IS891/IS1136/IS1341 domain-containing protein n=1 Tax=Heliobacterium modesticaldum (strain ATCC 51547 / Ice1) TaxID=498761 RepID=B0TCK1_HELMI|nr:conserved hypothetical protein [Heliomicrobium modesticaldum Ice1]